MSKLVGCPLIYNTNTIINPGYHSIYLNDSKIILEKSTSPNKKEGHTTHPPHWLFKKFGLALEIQTKLKIIDYLDISLILNDGTVS